MIQTIRKLFMVVVLVLAVFIVGISMANNQIINLVQQLLNNAPTDAVGSLGDITDAIVQYFPEDVQEEVLDAVSDGEDEISDLKGSVGDIEGYGVPYLWLIDLQLLLAIVIIASGYILPEGIVSKGQGVVNIMVAFWLVFEAIPMIFKALAKMVLMVVLLLAIPFGTIAYFVKYADFNRGAAAAVLAILMMLKIFLCIALVLNNEKHILNIGLLLTIVVSFVGNIVVSLLHGIVPKFLVSITDALAGIVVAIIGAIWGVVVCLIGIISVVMAIIALVGEAQNAAKT